MEGGGCWNCMCLFGGILLGDSNVEKRGDHWKMKFFTNKSIEALSPLKEGHQGLIKLHVPLVIGVCSSMGEKQGSLQKGNFVWSGKIMCKEACQGVSKSCVLFEGGLEDSNEKNGEATEGRGSIVKCGETLFDWGLVKMLWDSPCVTILQKLLKTSGEYLVDAWLDFVTKLPKYFSFAYSWSTSKRCKKWDCCDWQWWNKCVKLEPIARL